MGTMTLEEAQARLAEVVAGLEPGEQVVLTREGRAVATLRAGGWTCKAGSARDKPHRMAPDFDAPLEEFKEYMA